MLIAGWFVVGWLMDHPWYRLEMILNTCRYARFDHDGYLVEPCLSTSWVCGWAQPWISLWCHLPPVTTWEFQLINQCKATACWVWHSCDDVELEGDAWFHTIIHDVNTFLQMWIAQFAAISALVDGMTTRNDDKKHCWHTHSCALSIHCTVWIHTYTYIKNRYRNKNWLIDFPWHTVSYKIYTYVHLRLNQLDMHVHMHCDLE